MDSITQAALGSAVGYACWSRPLGRKALAYGFALGTLPDLDIVAYPLLDEVQRLYWHRGESHSIWFMIFGSWLTAWLLRRLPLTRNLSAKQALGGVFAIYVTHVLIDVFTVYGTQLLAPFSRHGFGTDNLFIIDPLFTGPLLLGILGALVLRSISWRTRCNKLGLALATLYVGWSFVSQAVATRQFEQALADQGIQAKRSLTSASAFNTVLWRHLVETETGFLIGYWSWCDADDAAITFAPLARDADAVQAVTEARSFGVVDWFSQGWWAVIEADSDKATVVDLRFGEIPSAAGQPLKDRGWSFAWEFDLTAGVDAPLVQKPRGVDDLGATMDLLWRRIQGNVEDW
ncbi:MAG: metal-dependent hydrolase [Synoicihabitans sp.]